MATGSALRGPRVEVAQPEPPPALAGPRWVDIAGGGADIWEFLDDAEEADKKYVVRSQHNRLIAQEIAA